MMLPRYAMISGVGTGWQSSNEHHRGSIMLDHYQRGGDLTNHIPIVNAYRLIYHEGLVGRVCQE